jgi:hypothetical protein
MRAAMLADLNKRLALTRRAAVDAEPAFREL